jgi:xanthine dehydrogenase accessory factor
LLDRPFTGSSAGNILKLSRSSETECIITADLPSALKQYALNKACFVTIATSSHDIDRDVLLAVINCDTAYLGMIGSKNKIANIFKQLLSLGISREQLAAVYAPMGLNIASIEPKEIALSIMSEILLVKNNGSAQHMKTVKDVRVLSD